jgi:hypothetical protein
LSDDPIAAVFEEFMNGKMGWRGQPPSCSLGLTDRQPADRLAADPLPALPQAHQDCHGEWLAQQEVAARRALGFK